MESFIGPRRRLVFLAVIILFIVLIVFLVTGYKSASKAISYLPKNYPGFIDSLQAQKNRIDLANQWYAIAVDQQGRIEVKSKEGKVIISALTYYAEFEGEKPSWGLQNPSSKLLNDSSIEINGTGPKNEKVKLVLICRSDLPKIDFQSKINYSKNTKVKRESLVASFAVPVSEVYRKNRTVDTSNFEEEYWLQKEGVRFGNKKNSALIYHTPAISSMQLQTNKNVLFINLDYSLDHPFVNIPYQKNGGKKQINLSESYFKPSSELDNSFSINIGTFCKSTPRLMLVPSGYKAGYVFTEHADLGNIRQQRAAYFGSEDITEASKATGGFVAHKIPVTKSVFYTGPVTSPGAYIYEGGIVSPLLGFLDQLYATGLYDLCLHTPDDGNSNRETLEESIKFMKERYNTICWIDHGFYGGKINRESLVCDGLDSLSPYYAADLWEKYDTKYFWSAAVEMIRNANRVSVTSSIKRLRFYKAYVTFLQRYASHDDLKNLNFSQLIKKIKTNYSYKLEMNLLRYNAGTSLPTPLYWQSPTRTRNFYSWATDQEKGYGDLSEKDIENERGQLSDLIKHQGIFIDHGYFVRNRSDDKTLKTVDGKLVINPNFDKILSLISDKRSKGDLYITTVRDLLSYWIKLEKVDFQYLPDGSVTIINNNDEAINGLSLVIRGNNVMINGKQPKMKQSGQDIIFWFDLPAHKQVKMTTE